MYLSFHLWVHTKYSYVSIMKITWYTHCVIVLRWENYFISPCLQNQFHLWVEEWDISGEIKNTRVITEQLLALEFFNNERQQTTAHGPNLAEELKITWIILNDWKRGQSFVKHESYMKFKFQFYWNAATLICMNCLGRFPNYNGRAEELWHTPYDLKAQVRLFLKQLVCP